jgi:hypothetical protein
MFLQVCNLQVSVIVVGCHGWADAEWIMAGGPLVGHNGTPFDWPTPGRLIGSQGEGHPRGMFGSYNNY